MNIIGFIVEDADADAYAIAALLSRRRLLLLR
jgi:hypothetical protein